MNFFLKNKIIDRNMPEYQKLEETGLELACFLYERHKDTSEYEIIKHSYLENSVSKVRYILGCLAEVKIMS